MAVAVAALHVLVIDDEPLMRWAVAETLRAAGHAVAEASDGASALRLLTADPPDVVLLDYRLPDSHGLMLLRAICRVAPRSRVVILTAFGDDAALEQAVTLGAWCVIEKPVDMRDLDSVVRAAACSYGGRVEQTGGDADVDAAAAEAGMLGDERQRADLRMRSDDDVDFDHAP